MRRRCLSNSAAVGRACSKLPNNFTRAGQFYSDLARSRLVTGLRWVSQKSEKQFSDLLGLLLLHPMPGSVHQMKSCHLRAGTILHAVSRARRLVSAPIALA